MHPELTYEPDMADILRGPGGDRGLSHLERQVEKITHLSWHGTVV
jgi:hypothetical protein